MPEGFWFLMNPTETSGHQIFQPSILPHQVNKAPHMQDSTNGPRGLALDRLTCIRQLKVDVDERLRGDAGAHFPGSINW